MSINQMVSKFSETYHKRHDRAREWRLQGKRIFGLLYGHTPEEILYAADIIPIQLVEDGIGKSYSAAKSYLEQFYCHFAVNLLGQTLLGDYDYLDGVIVYDACETAKVLVGLWSLHAKPQFFYWAPCTEETTGGAKRFYRSELDRLKKQIEDFTGKEISRERLTSAIETYNENRALMRRLYEIKYEKPGVLSERAFFDVFQAGLILPKEEHSRLVHQLLAEISAEAAKPKQGPRLLLSCVISEDCIASEADIVSTIEELGGQIVCDDLCFGPRYYWELTKPADDPMDALVDRYLGGLPMPFKARSEQWTELMIAEAQKKGAQGAVIVIPQYCTPYLWDYPYLKSKLKEKGISTLALEGEENIPAARTRTRIEAFLETLASQV